MGELMRMNYEMNQMSKLLREVPKVEIHTHLIGTADAGTIYQIAQRNRGLCRKNF